MKKLLLVLSILFLGLQDTYAQQLAFPTAKGAGAYVTGGKGGAVYIVDDLGSGITGSGNRGTFEWCIKQPGTKTIVFEVGGTIDYKNVMPRYYVFAEGASAANLTIAGQTAPGGITFEGQRFYLNQVPNVIWRYMRFAHWQPAYNMYGDDTVYLNSPQQIVDHCSFTNGLDETISIFEDKAIGEITVQNCLMTGSKTGLILGAIGGPHGGFTVVDNLFAGISHRFPNLGSKNDDRYDIINNSVYGHTARLITMAGSNDAPGYHTQDQDVNYIANYTHPSAWLLGLYGGNWPQNKLNIISEYLLDPDNVDIYSSMNYIKGYRETPQANDDDMWTNFDWNYGGTGGAWEYTQLQESPWFTATQFPLLGQPYPIKTAQQAWIDNLADTGANAYLDNNHQKVAYRTVDDQMWLDRANDDTLDRNAGWLEADLIFNHHTGFTRPAGWDTDNDGMPDTWEDEVFGDNDGTVEASDLTQDHNGDFDSDGVTNLYEYLNLIDGDVQTFDPISVTLSQATATINIPETVDLDYTFNPVNTTNQSGVWSTSASGVATVDQNGVVTPVSAGSATITFTANALDENSQIVDDSALITVTNNVINVTSVTINEGSGDTVNVLDQFTLTTTVLPSGASNPLVLWSSSNTGVATVDANGIVQPLGDGSTTITAMSDENNGITDTYALIVSLPTGATVTSRVNQSYGDIKEEISSGTSYNSQVELGYDAGFTPLINGFYFDNPGIPVGKVINQAFITFKSTSTVSGALDVELYGEDTNTPLIFDGTNDDVDSRAASTASETWTVPDFTAGAFYNTVDISSIIQEKIDKVGYTVTDPIVILADHVSGTNFRDAESYNTTPADAPLLTVIYDDAVSNIPVTSIEISPKNITVEDGTSTLFTVTVLPANATNKTYTLSADNIQMTDFQGDNVEWTYVSNPSNVNITATSNDNPAIKDTAPVTIELPSVNSFTYRLMLKRLIGQ